MNDKPIDVWYEVLPKGCPPLDAKDCDGEYYRISNSDPSKSSDFFSQRMLSPNKIFDNIDECIVRSLSVFENYESAQKRLKLPKFKKAHIAKIKLENKDGKIKKTFGPHHYSWWRTKYFDYTKAIIL